MHLDWSGLSLRKIPLEKFSLNSAFVKQKGNEHVTNILTVFTFIKILHNSYPSSIAGLNSR